MRAICIFIMLLPLFGLSQSKVALLFEEMPNDTNQLISIAEHTGVLPMIRQFDSILKPQDSTKNYITVSGIGDLGFRMNTHPEYRIGGGVMIESSLNSKWYLRLAAIGGVGDGDSTYMPRAYYFNEHPKNYIFTDVRGRVSYTHNEIFNFQAGLDHHFIGEGNRSLFLSDYGKPYPFAQIRTHFWRLEYTMLYQFFREQRADDWKRKNGATHHISFNAAKWLNIGIFETVVFMPKDTMLNRGYDAEYLNPIVFYRPQEYSMGSSDNVLVGMSLTAKYKKAVFYGQFILDEFFLAEVKAKSGWWANKYGGQIGVKGRNKYKIYNMFYRLEYNFVRPYTFAHLNSGQNYGNQGMTLSHPYNGNFMEILGEIKAQTGKWSGKLFLGYFLKGLDKNGFSYGGDLYQPYTNRPGDYGHFIGQGKGNNGLRINVHISYCLERKTNLQAFIENQFRYDSAYNRMSYLPLVGIRSQLWNDYRNY